MGPALGRGVRLDVKVCKIECCRCVMWVAHDLGEAPCVHDNPAFVHVCDSIQRILIAGDWCTLLSAVS
jgi:hypothetical protein